MAYQSRETKLGRNVKRNNLRVDGISESRNETWEECKEEIQKVFNEKLCVKNVQIERAHCSKRNKSNNNSGKPRTIVCKLLNYKLKEEILRDSKKPKGSNIFINENFCYETMQYRRNYGKKSKTYEVRAKLSILIIDQLLRCQIKAIQGK